MVPDAWLVVAIGLAAGGAWTSDPWVASGAVLGAALALRRHVRWPVLAVTLGAFAFTATRATSTIGGASAAYDGAVDAVAPPRRCVAQGTIVASPVQVGTSARIDVDLTSGACGPELATLRPIRARLYGGPLTLARGDTVEVIADLAPVHLFANAELDDRRTHIARTGVVASGGIADLATIEEAKSIDSTIDHARAHVRDRINATFDPEARPLARALVLGETDLEETDRRAFQSSGLSHILAVSGTHLVLTAVAFSVALRAVLLRITSLSARADVGRISAFAAIPVVWIYAEFAGASGSAIRAASMLTAVMLTRTLARRVDPARAIAWSIGSAAVFDPLLVYDVSFILSAAATAGLLWLSPWVTGVLSFETSAESAAPWPLKLWRRLRSLLSATLAANAACAPVLLLLSPSLPLLGVLANVVAAPLGETAALPICLSHVALAWWPAAEQGAADAGSGALLGILWIARATAAMGWQLELPPPTGVQLAVLAIAIAATMVRPSGRRLRVVAVAAVAIAAVEIGAIREGRPTGVLRVTALDVGQGDATLIDFPDGTSMLIDAGGFVGSPVDTGERVVLPVLRHRRRHRIDVVVVSHPHPDHFGGMPAVFGGIEVGELWDTGEADVKGAGFGYVDFLAQTRRRGIPVRLPPDLCDQPRDFGGARIEILWPCPGISLDASPNDNSLVLRITYGDRSVLLVGDAEEHTEHKLVASGVDLRADLLKVGHHGSRTSSTPGFIAAVDPEWATISSGIRNRFGHPHPKAIATLVGAGVKWAQLDRGGQVVWQTDGVNVNVERPRAR